MKATKIGWIDAQSVELGGWQELSTLDDLGLADIVTAGIILRETDEYVLVVQAVGDGYVVGGTIIPKVNITSRKDY